MTASLPRDWREVTWHYAPKLRAQPAALVDFRKTKDGCATMQSPQRRLGLRALVAVSSVALAGFLTSTSAAISGIPSAPLSGGSGLPMISAGFWQVTGEETGPTVTSSFDVGLMALDGSCIAYRNEVELGQAIRAYQESHSLPRSSFYVTSKLDPSPSWNLAEAYEKATAQLNSCLHTHQVSALDLLLVHVPMPSCEVNQELWRATEDFYKAGKAKDFMAGQGNKASQSCKATGRTRFNLGKAIQ